MPCTSRKKGPWLLLFWRITRSDPDPWHTSTYCRVVKPGKAVHAPLAGKCRNAKGLKIQHRFCLNHLPAALAPGSAPDRRRFCPIPGIKLSRRLITHRYLHMLPPCSNPKPYRLLDSFSVILSLTISPSILYKTLDKYKFPYYNTVNSQACLQCFVLSGAKNSTKLRACQVLCTDFCNFVHYTQKRGHRYGGYVGENRPAAGAKGY